MATADATILETDQDANDWIASQVQELRIYIDKKTGDVTNENPDLEILETYFQIALNDLNSGELEEEDLINMFGAGFGQYFVDKAGFRWVTFADEYGEDLAVQSTTTGIVGFPLSSTMKRLEDETAGRFDAIFQTLTKN